MIIADSCSVILLAKSSVLETAIDNYDIQITTNVFKEIMKGKEKMTEDILLLERLNNEDKIRIIKEENHTNKLSRDFNMGLGEASTISSAIKNKCIVMTDNRQGRKAAKINNLQLVGSPEIIVDLHKKKKIDKEKAIGSLNILKKEGWFDGYIIEKAMEDIK